MGNAAATEAEQQARADEESARKLLDAASGATGKSEPTYHSSFRNQSKDEDESERTFESRADEHTAWKKAVDQYVSNADDVATLTSQDMRDAVREHVSEEVLVTHASAIEDYFEQSCARRRSGLAADHVDDNENASGRRSSNTPSKNQSHSTAQSDRAERLRSAADGSLNKSSPSYHKSRKTEEGDDDAEQARQDRAERLRSAADGSLNKSSPSYHKSRKTEEGDDDAEQARQDRAERLRSAADGSLNKSSPSYHQSSKKGQGAEERKDWHDAIDKYLDDNEGGETSLDAMRSAVRDAIGGDELVSNAAAIEEYFQVTSTRRNEERLARREGGGDADANEGAQKRSRSGDANQTHAMASAPKAARTG